MLDIGGESTAGGIDLTWGWPPWAVALAIALAAAIVVWSGWRARAMLIAMRLGALAIVLAMIAQAALLRSRTAPPAAVVLIDDSRSMAVVDGDGPSRFQQAQQLLAADGAALLRGLSEKRRLRVGLLSDMQFNASRNVQVLVDAIRAASPDGPTTRLGQGLLSALGQKDAALVVALTDGQNTEGPTLDAAAAGFRRRGVPLHFIGLGRQPPARSVALADPLVDDVALLGDAVFFECRLSAVGLAGQTVRVALREDGKPDPLARCERKIASDERPERVQLVFRPSQIGTMQLVAEAEPMPGDPPAESNRLPFQMNVRKETFRVLLAWAAPSFEYRYLRNMLRRDETIALSTFLQEADLDHADQDAAALRAFPSRRAELFEYDAVILGDVDPQLLGATALRNLVEFVDRPDGAGGALILVAGPSFMPAAYGQSPLARLFPFPPETATLPEAGRPLTEGFVLSPTELGLASPAMQLGETLDQTRAIWRRLAPLYWFVELSDLAPGARVMAEHPSRCGRDGRPLPIFCAHQVGSGRVLFHATDETWRWRYRSDETAFARYWVQTIRQMCRAKWAGPVALETDRRRYAADEPVRLRARWSDERLPADQGVVAALESAGRPTRRVTLQRAASGRAVFEADLGRLAPGDYRARLAAPLAPGHAPSVDFTVESSGGERLDAPMDAAAMRRAAQQTGGRFYTLETAGRLVEELPPARPVKVESLPPWPLWNRWPVLAILLVLLCAEWAIRRGQGGA